MSKYTPAEKLARQQLVNAKLRIRQKMIAGDVKGAREIATEYGITIWDARLALIYNNASEPFYAKLALELGETHEPPPDPVRTLAWDESGEPPASQAETTTPFPQPEIASPAPEPIAPIVTAPVVQTPATVPPPPPAPPPAPTPLESVKGWPVKADATVWALCPNRALVVIQLPDGRTASMWKGRRIFKIYDKVQVELAECEADPIYAVARI